MDETESQRILNDAIILNNAVAEYKIGKISKKQLDKIVNSVIRIDDELPPEDKELAEAWERNK